MWTFFLCTFGCKVNQYETQAIREAWQALGGTECEKAENADLILINSCAITAKGEGDARRTLFRMRRLAPQARIIFTGCAATLLTPFLSQAKAMQVFPDLLLPQQKKEYLLGNPFALLNDPKSHNNAECFSPLTQEKEKSREPSSQRKHDKSPYPPFHIEDSTRHRPVIKVQDGCSHRCTYCIVPTMRSQIASRKPEEVLFEVRTLLAKGYSECILSGINLAEYGKERPEYGNFWDLVAYLDANLASEYEGKARLRISSVSPSQLDSQGITVLRNTKLLCPQLHISLQHASRSILRRMGRGYYTASDLREAIAAISSFWPTLGLGCDIIVGFPGEREEDFTALFEFCRTMPFTYGHIFPYSRRPGTKAITFSEAVADDVRKERAHRLRLLFQEKKHAFLQKLFDTQSHLHVIADEYTKETGALQKGISEYYTFCYFTAKKEECTPALFQARPIGIEKEGLIVERCEEERRQSSACSTTKTPSNR